MQRGVYRLTAADEETKFERTDTNNYLKTLLNPFLGAITMIPDTNMTAAMLKSVKYSGTITAYPSGSGLLVLPFHSRELVIREYVWDNLTNKYYYLRSITPDEDLSQNFLRMRFVSGGLEACAATLTGTAFTVSGIMNAIAYQDLPELSSLTFAQLLSYAKDNQSAVGSVAVAEGVTALAAPDDDMRFFIPETGTTASMEECLDLTYVGDGNNTNGWDYDQSHGTTSSTNFFQWSKTNNPLPPNPWGWMQADVNLNIEDAGDSVTGFVVKVSIARYYTVMDASTQTVTTQIDQEVKYVWIPPNAENGFTYSHRWYDERPLSDFVINATLADQTLAFGFLLSQITTNRVTLSFCSVYQRGNHGPGAIIAWQDMNPGQTMAIRGVCNYEVVPNFTLARNVSTTYNRVEDIMDMQLADVVLGNAAEFGIRFVYPRSEYRRHSDTGNFDKLTSRTATRYLAADALTTLKAIWNKVGKPIAQAALPYAAQALGYSVFPMGSKATTQFTSTSGKEKAANGKGQPKTVAELRQGRSNGRGEGVTRKSIFTHHSANSPTYSTKNSDHATDYIRDDGHNKISDGPSGHSETLETGIGPDTQFEGGRSTRLFGEIVTEHGDPIGVPGVRYSLECRGDLPAAEVPRTRTDWFEIDSNINLEKPPHGINTVSGGCSSAATESIHLNGGRDCILQHLHEPACPEPVRGQDMLLGEGTPEVQVVHEPGKTNIDRTPSDDARYTASSSASRSRPPATSKLDQLAGFVGSQSDNSRPRTTAELRRQAGRPGKENSNTKPLKPYNKFETLNENLQRIPCSLLGALGTPNGGALRLAWGSQDSAYHSELIRQGLYNFACAFPIVDNYVGKAFVTNIILTQGNGVQLVPNGKAVPGGNTQYTMVNVPNPREGAEADSIRFLVDIRLPESEENEDGKIIWDLTSFLYSVLEKTIIPDFAKDTDSFYLTIASGDVSKIGGSSWHGAAITCLRGYYRAAAVTGSPIVGVTDLGAKLAAVGEANLRLVVLNPSDKEDTYELLDKAEEVGYTIRLPGDYYTLSKEPPLAFVAYEVDEMMAAIQLCAATKQTGRVIVEDKPEQPVQQAPAGPPVIVEEDMDTPYPTMIKGKEVDISVMQAAYTLDEMGVTPTQFALALGKAGTYSGWDDYIYESGGLTKKYQVPDQNSQTGFVTKTVPQYSKFIRQYGQFMSARKDSTAGKGNNAQLTAQKNATRRATLANRFRGFS